MLSRNFPFRFFLKNFCFSFPIVSVLFIFKETLVPSKPLKIFTWSGSDVGDSASGSWTLRTLWVVFPNAECEGMGWKFWGSPFTHSLGLVCSYRTYKTKGQTVKLIQHYKYILLKRTSFTGACTSVDMVLILRPCDLLLWCGLSLSLLYNHCPNRKAPYLTK